MRCTHGPVSTCFSLLALVALGGCSDGEATAVDAPDSGLADAALPADAAPFLPADAGSLDAAPPWARGDGATLAPAVDAGPDFSELDFSAFDQAVDAFVKQHGLKGASAVVVHRDGGELHAKGYGSFSQDRTYLIASCSKILSVGVLMRLADQGLVSFDTPVSTYLSAWGSFKTDVKLAQAFSNSAGMVGLVDNPLYLPYLCQYTPSSGSLGDCAKTIYTADDAIDRKKPDSEFHYGGGQWQLAGGVAEVVSKKSWAELVQETYVAPCGTSSLGYTNQYEQATLSTLGLGAVAYPGFFTGDVSTLPKTDNPSIEGGAYVQARDYGKILLMHLRGGLCGSTRVLSEAAVARMQEDRIGEVYGGSTGRDTLAGYGMGWWVDRAHPGVVVDPGAYGAVAYLDNTRGYGVFIAVEQSVGDLVAATKPALDALFTP
jgi:CubicO group peptidase (beta-lactamase class C family)